MNVTYPLIREEIAEFSAGKRAILIVEEGQPAYIEDAINAILRKADLNTTVVGKAVLPMAGEYTGEVVLAGVARFVEGAVPRGLDLAAIAQTYGHLMAPKKKAAELLDLPMPARPPGFCVGCPERPVFSAMKIVEKDLGPFHVSADIGCHTFSTLPPFNIGNTVLGYGLGLASAAAVAPAFGNKRVVSMMGDGGFWHNGLTSGIASAVFNRDDGVLMIMKNGYTSATGAQHIPSSGSNALNQPSRMGIERTLKGLGVQWLKVVHTYHVADMARTLRQALTTRQKGLKVIIAEGECQLERQRRVRPQNAKKLATGARLATTRFGVDEDVCTGDHSCIRLSGCPSLTVKPNPDPLRRDPVARVDNGCLGCGLCGEVAHAAVLCPSFYRAEIVQNPKPFELWLDHVRRAIIGRLRGGRRGKHAAELA
jgi:indolepyruvate ferredoxin oxidoreductase alpha subunit